MATNKVPTNVIDMSGDTGGLVWAKGTSAQRPSGTAGDLRLNTTDSRLEYRDNVDWKRFSEGAASGPSVAVDFLVVGGGGSGSGGYADGSGGIGGAGAGAGGLRTSFGSTSGGGASNESQFNAILSTSYTVTVGAGGNSPSTPTGFYATGNDGNASVFATITSLPGGRAGSRLGGTGNGGNGTYGSGGANASDSATENSNRLGTTGQGFESGGTTNSGGTPPTRSSSGGGGAGGAGVKGGWDAAQENGGTGGLGLAVSITGASVGYAGGGGGGAGNTSFGVPGGVGTSGGGSGGSTHGGAAGSGTVNTGGGGGGGGAGSSAATGGAGGSGVVILRYPNTFTISVGAGLTSSTTTDGSDKITSFTAGSDTVSFS